MYIRFFFFFFFECVCVLWGGSGGDVRPGPSGPEPNWFDDWEQNGHIEIFFFFFFYFFPGLVMRNGFVQIKTIYGALSA
jgi:hypothetical protein